jgi:hypothetical protein
MEVEIVVTKWKIVEKDDKTKTIGGTYVVMWGKTKVSETSFNDGYNSTDITIPVQLMVEVEALDRKIKEQIVTNFTG